jgi:hypothetical protein
VPYDSIADIPDIPAKARADPECNLARIECNPAKIERHPAKIERRIPNLAFNLPNLECKITNPAFRIAKASPLRHCEERSDVAIQCVPYGAQRR